MRTKALLTVLFSLFLVTQSYAGPIGGAGQPRDSDLTTISALVCTDGQILKKASGVWSCGADAGAGGGVEPSDGDKTDITVMGGTTWTINPDAVTNAKAANMAVNTIKCRATAGTGDPEDCTATQVRTIINVVDGANVTTTATQTLSGKTLTTPTIADFTNATHAHSSAATGGTIPYLPLVGGTLTGAVIGNATSSVDFTAALTTFPSAAGTTPPGTCTNGQTFFDTDAAAASNWLTCVSNTWTPQGANALLNNTAAAPPTAADDVDAGYSVYSQWRDTSTVPATLWVNLDNTADAAVWATVTNPTVVTPTSQQVFNAGKVIGNANSESNSQKVGVDLNSDGDFLDTDEGGKSSWYDPAVGFVERVYPDGDRFVDIPSTFANIWRYNSAEAMRLDSSTLKFASTWKPIIPIYWDAGSMSTDGTGCAEPTEETINSGVKTWNFGCGDGGTFYGKIRLRSAVSFSDTMSVIISLRTIGTSSVSFDGDVSMACRSVGDTLNNTWGTAVQCQATTGTTTNLIKECTTAAITPGGTCAAGDWLFWRFVVDDANNTATAATAKVLGGFLNARYSQLGE